MPIWSGGDVGSKLEAFQDEAKGSFTPLRVFRVGVLRVP